MNNREVLDLIFELGILPIGYTPDGTPILSPRDYNKLKEHKFKEPERREFWDE